MSPYDEDDGAGVKSMDRREFLKLTAAGAGAVAVSMALGGCMAGKGLAGSAKADAAAAAFSGKYKDHNVVLVSFDALQAAHVHTMGYGRNVTPTIDAMARRGYKFTTNISVSSWTVPASMTWFTGNYPSEHRLLNKFSVYDPPHTVIANLKKLSPELVTLAEVLKANGYATGGFTGNAGVNGIFGYDQGFDTYFYEMGKFGSMGTSIPKALDWIKANRDNKMFVFLHGYDAHGQSIPVGGYDYRYVDKGYDRRFTGSAKEQEALREEGLAKGRVYLRDEDVRFWRAIYDEKISRVDAMFAHFLEEYDKLGLTGKTLFVLTSDHGTEFYEHHRFDHGYTLFDELIHTPLIVSLPGQQDARIVSDQISSVDVMPTILDLLGVRMPERAAGQLRGLSLAAAMAGQPVARDVYSETDYRLYTFKRSIRTKDGWKFIATMENGQRELYNLNSDPGELQNVAEAEPRIAYELEQKLYGKFKSIGHDLNGRSWVTGLSPVYDSQAIPVVPKK